MVRERAFAASTVALGLIALVHALVTWPLSATFALFGAGAIVAFVAEAVVVTLGWLDHKIGPTVGGVPLYILSGWVTILYVTFRIGLLVTDGGAVVVVAAVFATLYDGLTDHLGVRNGYWEYTDDLPGPRYRGVPWWNFVGWFVISYLVVALTLPFVW